MKASTELALDTKRGLPASPEAEASVLGAVMLDNALGVELSSLSEDDFLLDSHRRIFRAVCRLHDAGFPIDIITLPEELSKYRDLDSIGGVAFLATLTDGVPRRTSLTHYARTLRQKSQLRKLIHLGQSITESALAQNEEPLSIIELVQRHCLDMALADGEGEKDIFVDATEFCRGFDAEPDWLIEGLVEKGSNGIVAADPKGAKSLTVAGNMSVCLALGIPWLGLPVKRRTRVALVSREDNPATTKRRIRQIMNGKGSHIEELKGWLQINSKEQSRSLMLDNPREVNNLIRCLKKWESQFVILDVFNKLHVQDENDNTKVRAVMNQIDRIQAETGAQICVLHHWNKGDASQGLTRRIRGAGAIAGFAEWIAGIEMVDDIQQVRCISFETKVGEYVKPIHFQILDDHSRNGMEFKVVEPDVVPTPMKVRRVSDPGARI